MELTQVNPKMIILAREYRGIQQEELSAKIGITQGFLSKIEKGLLSVSDEILDKLCSCLELDRKFFLRRGDIFPPNLYYRKKSKTSPKLLNKAEAEMNVYRISIQELLQSVDIDTDPLLNFDLDEHGDPKTVAKKARQLWGLPAGPIINLFDTIEKRGVIIVQCNFDSTDIDGRSMFTDRKQPIIFVNKNMPMCRQRFTVAHELAHLFMHINNSVSENRDTEKEANLFASEFLVPEKDLKKQILTSLTLSNLADLKKYWRVSMQAILYKANDSRLISSYNHKNLIFDINKYQFRTKEPMELDPPIETPKMLNALIKLHLNDLEFTEKELSSTLGLTVKEFKNKYLNEEPKKLRLVY